jgi:hypothetical protein
MRSKRKSTFALVGKNESESAGLANKMLAVVGGQLAPPLYFPSGQRDDALLLLPSIYYFRLIWSA